MENNDDDKLTLNDKRSLLQKISNISGMEAINRILELDDPSGLIKGLSLVDFFWLVKRVGEEDSHALLGFASNEQWQYLLDMEIWKRDHLDPVKVFSWIERLFHADGKKLANFFYGEGTLIAHHYFYYNIHVVFKQDDDQDIPDDFITFDNIYYMRILDKEHEEIIEKMLKTLASEDYDRFQALLLGLTGVVPAEIEEEMYRLKSVRLAETGYLPFEEAISVYSRIDLEKMTANSSPYMLYFPEDEGSSAIVPITPFFYTKTATMLARTTESYSDELLIDRLRLEFGGLCNQVMSADGTVPEDIDTLKSICRKTAGYINIGLEKLSGGDLNISRTYIENNPLISLFRTGFTVALELKWEADRFIKKAWYKEKDLSEAFWGDEWEGILRGLILKKPMFFSGESGENEYRDFEFIAEIEECRRKLLKIYALDTLLAKIYTDLPVDNDRMQDPVITFHSMLFNYWACNILRLEPGFFALPLEKIKDLFELLRAGYKNSPYGMPGYEEVFINDLTQQMDTTGDETLVLKETLTSLWKQFRSEYEYIMIPDLDPKYIRYFYVE